MIDAESAFKQTKERGNARLKDEILTISKIVDEAISKEKYEAEIPNISTLAQVHLEGLGYKIGTKNKQAGSQHDPYDVAVYILSWANPNNEKR